MAEHWGDYWWVVLLAGAAGAFLAPIIGYFRRPRNGHQAKSTVHGAVVIDSSIGERVAMALEDMVEIEKDRDKHAAAERHNSELETLRREIAELKRTQR